MKVKAHVTALDDLGNMIEPPVGNRTMLKAMQHCLDMYRSRSEDHSEAALLLALHRAGYSAASIEKNQQILLSSTSTPS